MKTTTLNFNDSIETMYQVGTLVNTLIPVAGVKAGIPGVVYDQMSEPDGLLVSILLANGYDLGVFNEVEAAQTVESVGHLPLAYHFTSPAQLQTDYQNGLFDDHFDQAAIL